MKSFLKMTAIMAIAIAMLAAINIGSEEAQKDGKVSYFGLATGAGVNFVSAGDENPPNPPPECTHEPGYPNNCD